MVTSWPKLSLAVPTSVKDDLFLTMRAMVLTQQKRVEESPLTQREMDAPRAGPGEVRVK